ncbi:MAG: TlpA disulfide reductase family protein [Anaerolineae bacterium]
MNEIEFPSALVQSRADTDQVARRLHRLIGIAMVIVFGLAACTASRLTDSSPPSGEANLTEVSPAPDGAQAPLHDFQITLYQGQELLGGDQVDFSAVLGQGKPVVLNFWASLCPPCRLEMPDFQELHQTYNEQVLLLGVDVGVLTGLGNEEDGRALLQEVGITYPAGATADAEVLRAYQVLGMPTTLFITPDGEIIQKWTGLLTRDKMDELVQELLEAGRTPPGPSK